MSVQEVQSQALAYASAAQGEMSSFLSTLSNIGAIDSDLNLALNNYSPSFRLYEWASSETLSVSDGSVTASAPATPTIPTIAFPDIGSFPELTLADPVIDLPTAPSATLPAAPSDAPEFSAPSMPDRPTLTLPAVPTLASLSLPEAPTITLPSFDASLPVDDVVAPSAEFDFAEQRYSSALLDAASAKLLGDLQNGGYGIEPEDEEAIWERARERELRNSEQAVSEVARQAAARGFAVPTGAMLGQLDTLQQQALEKTSSMSREIALKRADLYVQNRQFTLQQVQALEAVLIGYYSAYAERSLNAAKAVVDAGVAIFNSRVQRLGLNVEIYRARAAVFETQLKAALSHLDVFKSQVEAAKLSQEAQAANVALYTAQVDGVRAVAAVYSTEIEAAKAVASIESLRLDAFKSRVETYTAQVAAKGAEFDMYKARLSGEKTKVDVYQSAVEGYKAKAAAYSSKVSAGEAVTRAQVAAAGLTLDTYRAELTAYTAELDRQFKNIASQIDVYKARVQKFSVDAEQAANYNRVAVEDSKARAEIEQAQTRNAIAAAGVRVSAAEATAKLGIAAADAGARVSASVVSSALTAASGLAAEIVETTA